MTVANVLHLMIHARTHSHLRPVEQVKLVGLHRRGSHLVNVSPIIYDCPLINPQCWVLMFWGLVLVLRACLPPQPLLWVVCKLILSFEFVNYCVSLAMVLCGLILHYCRFNWYSCNYGCTYFIVFLSYGEYQYIYFILRTLIIFHWV